MRVCITDRKSQHPAELGGSVVLSSLLSLPQGVRCGGKGVAEKIGFDVHACWQLRFPNEVTGPR